MSKLKNYLVNIANAIRQKNGFTKNYHLSEMAQAITNLQGKSFSYGTFTISSCTTSEKEYYGYNYKVNLSFMSIKPKNLIAFCNSTISTISSSVTVAFYYSSGSVTQKYIKHYSGVDSFNSGTSSGKIIDIIENDVTKQTLFLQATGGTSTPFRTGSWRYVAWV